MKSLQQMLGYQALTGIIQSVQGNLPTDTMPPNFMAVTRQIQGDTFKFRQYDSQRATSRRVNRGDASVRREHTAIAERTVSLYHSFEHIYHEPIVLDALMAYDNLSLQQFGQQEIDRRTADFRALFNNSRFALALSVLGGGKIQWDANGYLLAPGDSGAVSIDFGVPAGNQNQLNVGGWGTILDGKWSAAATTIAKQIANLKLAARKLTGYQIRHAFYGANVLEYMLTNTNLSKLIQGNAAYANVFAGGGIPSPFLGLNWHPIVESFYIKSDGTTYVSPITADMVVFTPDPSPDWWEYVEGTYRVPTDIGVSSDGAAARGNFAQVAGMFSYATIDTDPPGIKHLAGDTCLPVLKVPSAIFQAVVHW